MLKFSFYFFILLQFAFGNIYGSLSKSNEKQVLISERIVMTTDRKVYIAGENLLYSLFLIDTRSNSLAGYPSIGYVLIRNTKGEVLGKSQVKIRDGKAAGAVYLSDTLHSGYYQVVAYTNFMRNGSEDIFFKSQVLIANRFDNDFFDLIVRKNSDSVEDEIIPVKSEESPLHVLSTRDTYQKREKAVIKISLSDKDIRYTDLSISVVGKNLVEERISKNTSRSAWVSKAAFFDVPRNDDKPLYLAENKNAELLGRLTDAEKGTPLGYHVLYLTSPDTLTNFEYSITDPNGYFRFPLPDYYNGKDLFIQARATEGETLNPHIIADSKFQAGASFSPEAWPVDSSLIAYLKESQNVLRIRKSFSQVPVQPVPMKIQSPPPFLYIVPDYTVAPADYAELNDFVEISREIIPALKIRKRDQDYFAEMLDLGQKRFLPSEPLIFLDGVLLDNISQVVPFGSRDIRKTELISSVWIVDHQELPGVLSIYSRNNLWKTVSLNKNNLRVKAEDYYELPEQHFPNYSIAGAQSREPDFRQLLYWNPQYRLSGNTTGMIEFYTSDHAASYLVKITGITDKGEKIEAWDEFKVAE